MSSDSSFAQRGPSIPVYQTTTTHTTYPASSTSTTAAYGVLLMITIYYLVQYLEAHHLPLSELMWNTLVYVTPSKMLSVLDHSFSSSTSKDPKDDKDQLPKGFDSQHHAAKSNSLRRLMGLDSNTGIITAVQRTRTLSDLSSVFKSKSPNALPGLGNWDHSCYQNSVLQGLASLESLPRFLGRDEPEDEQRIRETGSTREALRELMEKLNKEENVGKTFWTPSELKSMSSWQQQDAQEYFSKVMDGLEKDTAKAKKIHDGQMGLKTLFTNRTNNEKQAGPDDMESALRIPRMNQLSAELQAVIMRNPLEGLLAQRVGCQQCGYVEGLSLVPFNCLTVPLGREWMYDVRECLDEYTALEPIKGVECASCTLTRAKAQIEQMLNGLSNEKSPDGKIGDNAELMSLREDTQRRLDLIVQALEEEDFTEGALTKCQTPAKSFVSTTKSRQAVVARPPEVLVIHINRSIFDELTGEQSKNQATVRFPRRFYLGSWCLGNQKDDSKLGMENWNTNPKESMLDDIVDAESMRTGPLYKLRAVVTHYGRHENGHYICYRKSPYPLKLEGDVALGDAERGGGAWWRLSDEEVTEVSEESVLAQGGVFMLFYEQVPSPDRAPAPILGQEPEVASLVSTKQAEMPPDEVPNDEQTALLKSESQDSLENEPRVSSIYPTPPPEELEEPTTRLEKEDSPGYDQSQPTNATSQPKSVAPPPAFEQTLDTPSPSPSPNPTALTPSPSPNPTALTPPPDTTNATDDTYNQHLNTSEKPQQQSETPPPPAAAAALQQNQPSSPSSTTTPPPPPPPPLLPKLLSPRTGRENGGRRTNGNKAMMESMAGFVQAN